MSAPHSVIIFGPSGDVGSAAALQAYREGAKVTLAMRDKTKSIPSLSGIDADRVEADLTKPETIKAAVRQSKAKSAFIYAIFGTSDHMHASIEALKEAGIEIPVVLSSYSVQTDIRSVSPDDHVPWVHAQVEISLEEIYGKNGFVAVRPNYFASNILWFKAGIQAAEVQHANPEAEYDWISPDDIGRVCGSILARGLKPRIVWLMGSEKMAFEDAIGVVARALGRAIKVTRIAAEEALEQFLRNGTPEPTARWIVRYITENAGYEFKTAVAEEARGNVLKCTHRVPVKFDQWVSGNLARLRCE
ncbi:Nitrogen metabolite regulation-like protein bik4 [Penicillium rolfsii]|nr:Nitrogen metabolite regulation-like protein bik4 [Penicillium rolfsii]